MNQQRSADDVVDAVACGVRSRHYPQGATSREQGPSASWSSLLAGIQGWGWFSSRLAWHGDQLARLGNKKDKETLAR